MALRRNCTRVVDIGMGVTEEIVAMFAHNNVEHTAVRQLFQEGKKELPELSLVTAPSLLPTSPSLPSTMTHTAVGTHTLRSGDRESP